MKTEVTEKSTRRDELIVAFFYPASHVVPGLRARAQSFDPFLNRGMGGKPAGEVAAFKRVCNIEVSRGVAGSFELRAGGDLLQCPGQALRVASDQCG